MFIIDMNESTNAVDIADVIDITDNVENITDNVENINDIVVDDAIY